MLIEVACIWNSKVAFYYANTNQNKTRQHEKQNKTKTNKQTNKQTNKNKTKQQQQQQQQQNTSFNALKKGYFSIVMCCKIHGVTSISL